MKKWIILWFGSCFSLSIFSMGQMTFAKPLKLRTKAIKINEFPQTQLEVTLYSHVSEAKAYVLNNPGGNVKIVMDKPSIAKTDEGLNTPLAYSDSFSRKPKAYKFENRVDGTVYVYLLYAENINWLASFDKSGEIININLLGPRETNPDEP